MNDTMTDTDRCEPAERLREQDGRYWLRINDRELPAHWTARDEWWDTVHFSGGADSLTEMGYRCVGPITPPATVAALVEALEECADDLEALVMREYSGDVLTPGNALRRARDLAPVDAARAALALHRGEAGR